MRFQPSNSSMASLGGYGSAYGFTTYKPSEIRKGVNGDLYYYTKWQATTASGENDVSNDIMRLTEGRKRLATPKEAKLGDLDGHAVIVGVAYDGSPKSVDEALSRTTGPKASSSSSSSSSSAPAPAAAVDKMAAGTYYYANGIKFDVSSDGTMTKTGSDGKTKTEYKPSSSDYAMYRDGIRKDLKSGAASTTKFSKREAAAAPPPAPLVPVEEKKSITDKVWFWPAVALTGVGTLTTGFIIWKRRRAASQG